jgi:hypothetical protein
MILAAGGAADESGGEDSLINVRADVNDSSQTMCRGGRSTILALGLTLVMAASLAGCRGYSVGKRLDLWRKKLRFQTPASYTPMTVEEMIALRPGCPFHDRQVDEINRLEERSVVMEGHLVTVEQLADGKTYAHLVRRGDIHLEIGAGPEFNPEGSEAQRVICEVTVPFQWRHKSWNLEGLAPLAAWVKDGLIGHSYPGGTPGGAKVRISGDLLDDFVHCAAVGDSRATAWEIHPITKIEVWNYNTKRFEPLP